MNTLDHHIGGTRIFFLGLLLAYGLPAHSDDYVINTLGGTPTEGWDGPGTGSATINYYVGWSGAPSNNGLTFGSLTLAQVEAELANAMATWSAVVDVTFNYLGNAVDDPGLAADPWGTPGNETLVIYSHGTELANSYPFDGAGVTTVVAHAWGPPDIMGGTPFEFAGNLHIDDDENWLTGVPDGTSYAAVGGIDLESIFLKELGHSLGLGTLNGITAEPGGPVMAEYSHIALATLGLGDIAGVRQLYSFQGQDWSNGDPSAPPDSDGDGVPDDQDICPGGNDNVDTDGDMTPDYCDACPIDPDNDIDGDGICGDLDVCPGGNDTIDADDDGTPDACDACPIDPDNDVDGDEVCGNVDVCPFVADNQNDTDGDLIGDACDLDSDNDGVCDAGAAVEGLCTAGPDNCPLQENPSQSDIDGDGAGDACDTDVDGDNVVDNLDACPMTVPGEIVNADGCSVSDLCPCDNDWKNHGGYVRCVAHASEDQLDVGLISEVEKDALVSSAAASTCGKRN